MIAFDPDPKIRWLFCMTHPDDEISICAWIKRLSRAGAEVFINWTHSSAIRENEARIVAAILGVPESKLSFMHATDGNVCNELTELLPRFRSLVQQVQPDRICCGAFEQGHLDHDATNWLVNHAFDGPVFEIPFYYPYSRKLQRMNAFSDLMDVQAISLSRHEHELKLKVAKSYQSQNIWSVLWWYEVWQVVRLQPAELRKRELMRLQTHKDFTVSSHHEPIRSEVEACGSWRMWLAAVERANMSL